MWSKGTLYFAVFFVLAVVLVVYYLHRSHKSETFLLKEDDDDNSARADGPKQVDADDSQEQRQAYRNRVLVMKLFDTLLMRKASEPEIEKYSGIAGQEDIVKQIVRDFKVDVSRVQGTSPAADEGEKREPEEHEGHEGQETFADDDSGKPTDTKQTDKEAVESYAGFLPFEEVDFSKSSTRRVAQHVVKVREAMTPEDLLPTGSTPTPTAKDAPPQAPDASVAGEKVSVDKKELRARLEIISREVSKLSQLLVA